MEDETLVQLVRDRVREIPVGQVMSYGQVGDFVGCSAREAGWAMNQIADQNEAPWQRVVGSDGTLRIAKRSAAWATRQRDLLESEGVAFKPSGCVDMAKHQSGTLNGESKSAGKMETKKIETLELGFE
jgi:methylated-DNA-protein-cysteine methyltransferase-like protein